MNLFDLLMTPAMEVAINQLKELILSRYPEATFDVYAGDDPLGIRLEVRADVDDSEEVMDLIIDLLLYLQVKQGLRLYPLILSEPERPVILPVGFHSA